MAEVLTPAEVRQLAKESGEEVRKMVAVMPPSPERDEYLAITAPLDSFWDRASDDFLMAWLQVAIANAEAEASRG